MKRIIFSAVVSLAAATAIAADVGVSVSIGQPGFYGQIDIGGYPAPQVIYQQPRIIRYVEPDRQPIYLNVPPGHSRNWRKYCGRYNACDERVYFVRNNWYQREYAPRYQERQDEHRGEQRHEARRDQWNDHRGDGGNNHQHDGRQNGNHRDKNH